MGTATYRFLPWSKRGLSSAIEQADQGQPLDQRAQIEAGITVTGAGSGGVSLALYGPGDVIGIDPRVIVRTEPRANTSDCEPNYLAAIEFDLPELPWMFTPAAAKQDRLRPWLVLVVLEGSGPHAVGRPRVIRDRPLPFVELSSAQVASQLPDLRESWSWAHSQLMTEDGVATDTAVALAAKPLLNLSRLLCPRRLEAKKDYFACLVPAFDLGVRRGLGATPAGAALLQPAWDVANPADLTLPVYFHWEFSTGPDGDFESLARELKPFKCPPDIGTVPIHIWDSLPGLAGSVPQAVQDRPFRMDGALRAATGRPATLAEVDRAFQDAIRGEVDAPAVIAQGSAPDATRAVSAPLYGGFHANAARVPASQPNWLRELNLDPRARIAAGLGAEVVRANQEAFMQACWEQVGKVVEANALLNRGRLATEALACVHRRLAALPPAAQLLIAAPAHDRVARDGLTTAAAIARSSLPDASVSAPMRRLASVRRPALRAAARRLQTGAATGLVEKLAAGRATVDPGAFVPDGINRIARLEAAIAASPGLAEISLAAINLDGTLPVARAKALVKTARAIDPVIRPIKARTDLLQTGLVGTVHLDAVIAISTTAPAEKPVVRDQVIDVLLATARANPRAQGYLIDMRSDTGPVVQGLDVTTDGRITIRTAGSRANIEIGRIDPAIAREGPTRIGGAFDAAGLRTGSKAGGEIRITRNDTGAVGTRIGRLPGGIDPALIGSKTVSPLIRDAAVLDRFTTSIRDMTAKLSLDLVDAPLQLVPFALVDAGVAIRARFNPRVNVPSRLATMVMAGGSRLQTGIVPGLTLPPTQDRIMHAPDLSEPAYLRLAEFDKAAFMPGVDEIPHNSITLVETNPRFIEAYMIGLNHEMNRELLWRSYPTDQRGTPFRHFWDWDDGQADIGPIHQFARPKVLGHNTRGGAVGGQLVLLVRGHLLRRYPNSTIAAWRADSNKRLIERPLAGDYIAAAFFGGFPQDIAFAGFDLTFEQAKAGNGWFFVIEQQPTEPRFGFDQEAPGTTASRPGNWLDAHWIDTGALPGGHLRVAGPLAGHLANGIEYVRDAAHLAAVALQRPFRVAVHVDHLSQI